MIANKKICHDAGKEMKTDTLSGKHQGLVAYEVTCTDEESSLRCDELWIKDREIGARRNGVLEDRREDCPISEQECDREASTSDWPW
jgi:hypothetical protein